MHRNTESEKVGKMKCGRGEKHKWSRTEKSATPLRSQTVKKKLQGEMGDNCHLWKFIQTDCPIP